MAITNLKSEQKLTFAIAYGFTGGPRHSQQMRRHLHQLGYREASLQTADILIIHSAGGWLLSPSLRPKIVIYVGMTLAPTIRTYWSLRHDRRHANALIQRNKSYYARKQPLRNLLIILRALTSRTVILNAEQSILIANQHDPWVRGTALDELIASQDWAFISLPGGHDDILEHPDLYVAIIDYHARLLA